MKCKTCTTLFIFGLRCSARYTQLLISYNFSPSFFNLHMESKNTRTFRIWGLFAPKELSVAIYVSPQMTLNVQLK